MQIKCFGQNAAKDESHLIAWFNEKISPIGNWTLQLDRFKWNELRVDCEQLRNRLSNEIHWTRYETKPTITNSQSSIQQVVGSINNNCIRLFQNVQQLFTVYNREWLQLVPLFLQQSPQHSKPLAQQQNLFRQIEMLLHQDTTAPHARHQTHIRITIEMLTILFLLDQAKIRRLFRHNPPLFQEYHCNTIGLNLNSSQLVFDYFLLHCFLLPTSGGSSVNGPTINTNGAASSFALRTELRQRLNYGLFHRECESEYCNRSFPMQIKQLSDDLRNGIRLAKLVEILFDCRGLVEKLRFPANRLSEQEANLRTIFDTVLTNRLRHYFYKDDESEKFPGNFPKSIALGVRQSTIELLELLFEIDRKQLLEQHYRPHLMLIQQLQRTVRNRQLTRKIRQQFLQLRYWTLFVQQTFRRKLLTAQTRAGFLVLRHSTIVIQRRFRLKRNLQLIRRFVRVEIEKRRNAATIIQSRWKGYKIRQEIAELYPWIIEMVSRLKATAKGQSLPGNLTLSAKVEQTLKRFLKSYKTQKQQPLLKVAINRRLLDDIGQLTRAVYHSWEIVDSILSQHRWIFEYLCSILVRLNRSEQHKTLAYNLQSILLALLNRINKCHANHQIAPSSFPDLAISTTLVGAMLHLMNNYLHYVPLLRQSILILSRLIDIQQQSQSKSNSNCNTKLLAQSSLITDRRWQRLIERIRIRYQIGDGAATAASNPAPPTQLPLFLLNQVHHHHQAQWPKTPDQKSRVKTLQCLTPSVKNQAACKNLAFLSYGQSPSILQTPGASGPVCPTTTTNNNNNNSTTNAICNLELKLEFGQLIDRLVTVNGTQK